MASETHQIDAKVDEKGNLSLKAVPFRPGEVIHVILIGDGSGKNGNHQFKLRGKPVRFNDPTGPVAQDDWGGTR